MERALRSGHVEQVSALAEAVPQSDFVYTDTWVDMEFYRDEAYREETERRIRTMMPFQVNRQTLQGYAPYLMHDMPVHPGFEIEEELIESERSIVYRQAENRMYAQMALILHLLGLG
ncbi:hypothetical protein DLM86_24310 [Paenibacillus flagellatus]|uniref:Aspartate/ornithine carbamoyltransferase Asp/Orn-binding domain-containing protein n=2 Tax=Paenibacillus flagellatus TaxID=2211139 RepID=A0A2V5K1E8_9BACL|nr:hypothetical protein DLM86_24310 [Paenibacillus flagellatus]